MTYQSIFGLRGSMGIVYEVYGRFEGELIIKEYMISLFTCQFLIDKGYMWGM